MLAATRMLRHPRKTNLRPYLSLIGPQSIGEMPWKTRYTVTVWLISSTDFWKAFAIVGIAGK